MAINDMPAGKTLPNYEDPLGVAANFAKQFYSSNGTPKESNPPKPPANAPNSSPVTQKDGSSLPKTVQGVFANTVTEINNTIPAHGCSIKLPMMFKKLQQQSKLFPQINAQRIVDFAQWIGIQINPIVESIKKVIKAIMAKVKMIMKFIKWVQKQIKIIMQWVELFQEFIGFIMTLPAKLMQLVANCLAAAQSYATTLIKDTVNSLTSAANATSTGENAGTTANLSKDYVDQFTDTLGDIPGPDQVTLS